MTEADVMRASIIEWLNTQATQARMSARIADRMKVKHTYEIQAETYQFAANYIQKEFSK